MDTTFTLPIKSEYTIEDYDKLPETNTKIELIDGGLYMTPYAGGMHQSVDRKLIKKFDTVLPNDLDIRSPLNLRISDNKSFVPDIILTFTHMFNICNNINTMVYIS